MYNKTKEEGYGAQVVHISYVVGSVIIVKTIMETNSPVMNPATKRCAHNNVSMYAI